MFSKLYESLKAFIKENYKSLIAIIIIFALFMVELPFAIYAPGGAVDLNERIKVEDEYTIHGSFNMAYVSMVRGSIPFLLISKIIPDWDIVKKEDITYDGENMKEMMERERLYLKESQDAAIINAYKKANLEIEVDKINNNISLISEEAKTNLKIGDSIISINGIEINTLKEMQNVIKELDKDVKVNLKVLRDNKEIDAYAITYETNDGVKIGIGIVNTYEYTTDPKIEIGTKSSEMGSSGGLMMSLTIYNKLVDEDITHGKKIVGTGTIDIEGNVGEIGGVKYKLIGAVKNKADIFICPEANYKEALEVAEDRDYNIKIINVKTFDEALEKLAQIS